MKVISSSTSNDNTITSEEWKTHFEQFFRHENFNDDVDEENSSENELELDEIQDIVYSSPTTEQEMLKSVKALYETKTAGLDDLPPGILIHAIDILLLLMWHLFNRLYNSREFPNSWGLSCLIPLHKKGDTNCEDNYRGISLLDVFGKIYTSIINRCVIFFANLYSKISES